MTETQARLELVAFARRREHDEMADIERIAIAAALPVMERAIDLDDKYRILAAEHGTLGDMMKILREENAELRAEIAERDAAALERA